MSNIGQIPEENKMAKKAKKTRTDAERAAEFKRLATLRGRKALRGIAGLTALANPGRYIWTPKQRAEIEEALQAAITDCFTAFDGKKTVKEDFEIT